MRSIVRVYLVATFLLLGLAANAQLNYYSNNYYYTQGKSKVNVGVKVGLNISDFTDYTDDTSTKLGFNAGITVDYAISQNVFLSSGVEFYNKKINFTYHDHGEFPGYTFSFPDALVKAMYIQIPLHVGYKFETSHTTSISIHGGPYAAYGVGGKVEMGDWVNIEGQPDPISMNDFNSMAPGFRRSHDTFNDYNGFKNFDWGLGLGILFEVQRFGLGVNYDFGLQNISRTSNDVKVRAGYATLGYKF